MRGVGQPVTKRPGATDEEIATAEASTGIQFDDDLRALYRFSNGGEYPETWFGLGFEPFRFCGLDELVKQHGWHTESVFWPEADNGGNPWDPRIQQYHRHPKWLPIADFGNTNSTVYFDADPTEAGTYGQIIRFQHDPDEIMFVAPSLLDFLVLSNKELDENGGEIFLE
jgi:cell wall assembly regulator SMI1